MTNRSSSRLKNILNQDKNVWNDTDSEQSLTDNENQYSTDDERICCLVCSVLPNLSKINTCQKHLNSLLKQKRRRKNSTTQIVYMMHPPIEHCHCRRKSRHRSSSSSSSESRHHRKKRSMTIESSDDESQENDLFFSPDTQSQENQSRLSPSLPPSSASTIQTNKPKHYNELLLKPLLNKTNSSSIIEIDSDESCSPTPPVSVNRIVHVKDEDEFLNDNDQKRITINMTEATQQMLNNQYPQPVILLKRVCLDEYHD